jgi:signal transduction histidine kinase
MASSTDVDAVRRLERRMEMLLEVMGEVASASSEDAVARAITERAITALGAAHGSLWLVEREKHHLRMVAVTPQFEAEVERWRTVPIDLDSPLPEVVRTNQAIHLDSSEAYRARYPESFERIRGTFLDSPTIAYAMVPLVENDAAIGALAITYDRSSGTQCPSDRTFLTILARQCAHALRRIALDNAERTARIDAEEATRAREEILSVVSHDLRNPLGTILMGVGTLQQLVQPGDPKADRIRVIADRIQRQSERMARLIEDLVDFAGIQAGKLSIERRPTHPEQIIQQTSELFGSVANERGIGFAVDVPAGLPVIDVDPERAVQVLSNLLANAIKVTTKGGRVAIGAMIDGEPAHEVVFFVRDSGPGIEAEELPRLFERYWRSKKATYKGAGLGLSIARGIVDAHDGRIWAESQVGVGATFYFTLTPRVRA